jgi:hypothetical protein
MILGLGFAIDRVGARCAPRSPRGDSARGLCPIEIALKCLQLECLFRQLLEISGLLVGHCLRV